MENPDTKIIKPKMAPFPHLFHNGFHNTFSVSRETVECRKDHLFVGIAERAHRPCNGRM